MYEQIYCDPVAWMKQGKVDYISPQLYWTTTSTGQDYKKLCPWWSDVAFKFNKYFYSSMSMTALTSTYKAPTQPISSVFVPQIPSDLPELKLYTLNGGLKSGLTNTEKRISSATNFDDSEVGLEIDWNRNSTKNAAPGAVLYSIKHLVSNGKFSKYLREQKFTSPALTPAISWKSHTALSSPNNVSIQNKTLMWSDNEQNIRYSVYAIPNALTSNPESFNNAVNILGVSYTNQFDLTKYFGLNSTCKFAVVPMDRYGNEYTPVFAITTDVDPVNLDGNEISIIDDMLHIRVSTESKVMIYNTQGMLINSQPVNNELITKLDRGVYIVRINHSTYKIAL